MYITQNQILKQRLVPFTKYVFLKYVNKGIFKYFQDPDAGVNSPKYFKKEQIESAMEKMLNEQHEARMEQNAKSPKK